MPQQNRVDPWGRLHATPQYGTLMGNRGILHDDEGAIVRRWASKAWVTCVLDFRGRSSPGAFRPGRYSKLFFLDEATAFAAGHRPCGECRRARYVQFKQAWAAANGYPDSISARDMDAVLHAERTRRNWAASPVDPRALPVGAMFEQEGAAILVAGPGVFVKWSFDGYGPAPGSDPAEPARLITPPSIVRTIENGFLLSSGFNR